MLPVPQFLVRAAGGRVFHDTNIHSAWYEEIAPNASSYHISGALHIRTFADQKKVFVPEDACDGKVITEYTRSARDKIRQQYRENYSNNTCTPAECFPVHLPAMTQFRKIAAIAGKATLDSGDNQKRFEDSIEMTGDWRIAGPVWETPFGALVPEKIDGTFAAGRCISSVHDSWEVYHVIPTAVMTGEASGIAAAIASEKGCAAF
ncbi:MAG: FAD-dependent oxidoreductase [Lentisphaeria bacterium]|nr:MAG: FAD-dependent oxidoreductase [Lentisphaeria bacterium]